jgi:hypothetical protein
MGQATGLQGQSYAIPTVDFTHPGNHKLPLEDIRAHVLDFRRFASAHPELTFHVTPVGCGIAGYRVEDIAPLFRDPEVNVTDEANIVWPEEFLQFWGDT